MSKISVLVIDDSDATRALLISYLEEMEVGEIYEASGGKSAVELLQAFEKQDTHLDIIIVDWHMPELSGLEFIQKTRGEAQWDKTNIIVLTADTNFDVFNSAISEGVNGFLIKPITKLELNKKIPELIQKGYDPQLLESSVKFVENHFSEHISEKDYGYLKTIFESLNDFVILVDSNGFVLKANNRFIDLCELSPHKIFGFHFRDILREADSDKVWEVLKNDNHSPVKTIFMTNNQEPHPVLLSSSVIKDKKTGFEAYVVSAKDLSTEIELQEQLIESAKHASIGKLASGLAHEINNPLSIIMGYAQQFLTPKESDKIDIEQMQKASKKIVESAKRISKFIEGLRDFSKDNEQLPIESKSINFLVDETLVYCQQKFTNHNVQINFEKLTEEIEISCRPSKIQQVFLNILSNAYEVIKDQPTEQIIDIKILSDDNFVKVYISNSGSTISNAIKGHIFEPFYTSKKVGMFSGLGLSIAKKTVLQHKGKIYLDDDSSQTTFVVELPINKK